MVTLNAAAPVEVPEIPLTSNTLHGPHQHNLWGRSEIWFLFRPCKLCIRDTLRLQCHVLFSGDVELHTFGTFWYQISHFWCAVSLGMGGQTVLTCQSAGGWKADTISLMGSSGFQFVMVT